ncbi:MAG: hypothetical protein Q7U12_16040, partial [Undibacterium sp.]|nr:hypothetical protein [Undibacterium sp.]
MFDTSAAELVGKPMHKFLTYASPTADAANLPGLLPHADTQVQEISMPAAGKRLDAIYYRATFTNVKGEPAGCIGAL